MCGEGGLAQLVIQTSRQINRMKDEDGDTSKQQKAQRADELAAPNKIKDEGGGTSPGGKANKDPVTELFGRLTHLLVQRI